MNIACYVIEATERLRSVGIENPGLDAEVIIANCLNLERYQLVTWRDRVLSSEEISLIEKKIKRRLKKEPVAYIIGKKEFYGLDFLVTKDVLIPRPETELLVDMAIYWSPLNARVVDLCTGSGAIAIALKYTRSDLDVFASDISQKALKIAKKNCENLLGKNKISFLAGNLFEPLQSEKFDVIVSNPPYVDYSLKGTLQKELDFEPEIALYAEDKGQAVIKQIIENSRKYLNKNGILLLEIGSDQRDFTESYGKKKGFDVSILNDYSGLPRVATLRL